MRYIENGRYRHAKEILWEFIEKHRESPRFEEALSLYRRAVTKEKETQVDRCAVGCVVPLTGRYAPYGTKVLESILLASGVCDPDCNSEIKLIVRDSKGNVEETGNAIEALVLEDRVIVVIGPLGSSAAKAAAKKAQELKVPLVTLTQCEGITETGDYIFRNFLTSRVEMQNLVSYAVNNLGNRRFAVLYPGDSYGTEIMNLFSNAVGEEGGEIAAVQSYEREQTDFGDEIKGLVGLNSSRKVFTGGGKPLPIVDFDALFIADSAARARLIAPQLAFYDVTGIQLLGMSSWNTPVLVEGDSEYLEGAIFSDVFFHYSYYPEVVEFIDRFYAAYGRVPDGIESLAYDTAKIIKDIITGEIVDTRYEMRDRLCEVRDYQGTTGATHLFGNGRCRKKTVYSDCSGWRNRTDRITTGCLLWVRGHRGIRKGLIMRVLLTNDDGIYAEGISALYREMSKVADCIIVAPETEQSAVGHAITLYRPLRVRKARKGGIFLGHAVTGTPADCVKIGIKELSDQPVDLIVSGINAGANVGVNMLYSGTVSAATEGAIMGVPSIAVSLDTRTGGADFSFAARFSARLVSFMREKNFLKGLTLNVNVPSLPQEKIRGIAITKQGAARLVEVFEKRLDPRSNSYYWLAGETLLPDSEDTESDACALSRGFISITPIQHDLTRHAVLGNVRTCLGDLIM